MHGDTHFLQFSPANWNILRIILWTWLKGSLNDGVVAVGDNGADNNDEGDDGFNHDADDDDIRFKINWTVESLVRININSKEQLWRYDGDILITMVTVKICL